MFQYKCLLFEWNSISKRCSYSSCNVFLTIRCTRFQFSIQCSCQMMSSNHDRYGCPIWNRNWKNSNPKLINSSILTLLVSKTFEIWKEAMFYRYDWNKLYNKNFIFVWCSNKWPFEKPRKMINEIGVSFEMFITEPIFRSKMIIHAFHIERNQCFVDYFNGCFSLQIFLVLWISCYLVRPRILIQYRVYANAFHKPKW